MCQAVSTLPSFLLSSTLTLLLFAGMQMYRSQLASVEYMTILGGFLGSFVFIFSLTAVSNLETLLFGKGYQARLIPEVVGCLMLSMFTSALVHRVCVTTCFIFSIVALYFINKISQTVYAPIVQPTITPSKKKKYARE